MSPAPMITTRLTGAAQGRVRRGAFTGRAWAGVLPPSFPAASGRPRASRNRSPLIRRNLRGIALVRSSTRPTKPPRQAASRIGLVGASHGQRAGRVGEAEAAMNPHDNLSYHSADPP